MENITIWLLLIGAGTVIGVTALEFNKGVIVHLFEWKYSDIALECEQFLGPQGYAGVQTSPPSENLVIPGRPFYERYQPVSYKLITRSGTEAELKDMVKRCNKVGVRIIADVVLNHMTAHTKSCYGTGDSYGDAAEADDLFYPAVPYTPGDFHLPYCSLNDYNNATEVRVCEMMGLHDLNQTQPHVRQRIIEYLNRLIDMGMAGIRVDAAKHMYPADLEVIYNSLHNLNSTGGFPINTRPFICQEVPRWGVVNPFEYGHLGLVTEFDYGWNLGLIFHGKNDLQKLYNYGSSWKFLPDDQSLVFIENHDVERSMEPEILNYKSPRAYKMAIAFMLAWPYGTPKILSSYKFSDPNEGPPQDFEEKILSPRPIIDNICSNGWICQHRWPQVYNMVTFHNVVQGTDVRSWWDNGKNQIAFCRGSKGFIALNLENYSLKRKLQTCLPKGSYCDVISGRLNNHRCTGKTVVVADDGTALITVSKFNEKNSDDGVLAIHVQSSINS